MNCRLLFAFLLTLPPLTVVSAAPRKSQQTARRSVTDYFKLLPSQYFEVRDRRELLTKPYLPIIDLKNDYIRTSGDGAQVNLEIAVFRYRGVDTIAVTSRYALDYEFDLWRYKNRKWRKVTDDLSPMVSKDDLHFVIPRYGTTIKVFKTN